MDNILNVTRIETYLKNILIIRVVNLNFYITTII